MQPELSTILQEEACSNAVPEKSQLQYILIFVVCLGNSLTVFPLFNGPFLSLLDSKTHVTKTVTISYVCGSEIYGIRSVCRPSTSLKLLALPSAKTSSGAYFIENASICSRIGRTDFPFSVTKYSTLTGVPG